MVLDAVSNFVRGNTDAEVGTEDTTVSVVDASIFPDPETDGEFNVVIWDVNNFPRPDQDGDVEILRVTERDTTDDELTVTRGQEMTSAAAHPEGSAIHLSPTAKMFSDIESTFGDFWDAGTQELTADVNNTNTTTQALEAGEVTTENSAVLAYSDQITIPNATETKIPLDNVEFDQLDAVDQQNDKIILPTNGTYQISAVGGLRDDVDEEFDVRIKRNGSSEVIGRPLFGGGFTVPSFSIWPTQSREIEGLEGDEIELFVTQENSGEADAELYAGTRDRTAIRVRRV